MSLETPKVPATSLFWGSTRELMSGPLEFLESSRRAHGDVFRFRMGYQWVYTFAHPDQIRDIFTQDNDPFRKESGNRLVLGDTVLTTDGEIWERQRKHSAKYFSKEQLNTLFPTLHRVMSRSLAKVEGEVVLNELCVDIIYDLILALLFNVESGTKFNGLSDSINTMTDYVMKRSGALLWPPLWVPTKWNLRFKEARGRFRGYILELRALAAREDKKNLLDFLVIDPKCTERELENEALTFFLAGFETTANALFWAIYCLVRNPTELRKLEAEVRAVDLDAIASFQDLKLLPVARACVNEAMRLYPPAWFRSKILNADVTVGEYAVPKGSIVWVSPYVTHRHPEFWRDADDFRPDRFLAGAPDKVNPFAYIPFGGNRTICVGRDLAIQELIMAIAHLAKRFDLSAGTDGEVAPLASITLRPSKAYRVRMGKRSETSSTKS